MAASKRHVEKQSRIAAPPMMALRYLSVI